MISKTPGPTGSRLWAYAYDITLPEPDVHLPSIQELLEREVTEARASARRWAAQVVVDPQVTRILVVSDSPEQDRNINHEIEAALTALNATWVVTEPMKVSADDA